MTIQAADSAQVFDLDDYILGENPNATGCEPVFLILKNAAESPLGVLGYAFNIKLYIKYNEVSQIEFDLPHRVDGAKTPHYDDVTGMRIVELHRIGQFTLVNPKEEDADGVRVKHCKGYSLEHELSRKKITLEQGTFKFWDTINTEDTLLGRILEVLPNWQAGSVPDSMLVKYRTFDAANEGVYNFIKNTVQQSYGCIFTFDTMNRLINVADAEGDVSSSPILISDANLAKSIEITENTEDIVTRLAVNGADGIDIRDVNPTGTNKLIDLSHYMTERNFDLALIQKYKAWTELVENNRRSFYNLSIEASSYTAQRITQEANLTDLQGEKTLLENLQAVTIQAIAQGIKTQADLDKVNTQISEKQTKINAMQAAIEETAAKYQTISDRLKSIVSVCSFENYFTPGERKQMDRYMIDDEVADSTFVAASSGTYTKDNVGSKFGSMPIDVSAAEITVTSDSVGGNIYDIKGGTLSAGEVSANIISAVLDARADQTMTATFYLASGTYKGGDFITACVSIVGTIGSISVQEEQKAIALTATDGYFYLTYDVSEYQRRSVAWDLFEYGNSLIHKIASPTFSFSVTCANFLRIKDFRAFRNALRIGRKIYLELEEGKAIEPILIGFTVELDNPDSLELEFSDSFSTSDKSFRLVDLLDKSVSMGKNLDVSKYIYSSFIDSGAETGVRTFMKSALDVSKNAVLSSSGQAISWDGAGLRLRKWADDSRTSYEDEQIWMINNSIVMTADNWKTAQMAIGKFHDENLGDCWGIVAPRIVGTMLAGAQLVIESEKKDGGTAVFRVDGDGCRLYNSHFSVLSGVNHIVISPEIGIAIGEYPVFKEESADTQSTRTVAKAAATKTVIDEDHAKFWADTNGNLHLKGTLHGADGEFTGSIKAISVDESYFQVDGTKMGFFDKNGNPLLNYNNGQLSVIGAITATSLRIVYGDADYSLDDYIERSPNVASLITAVNQIDGRVTQVESKVTDKEIVNAVRKSEGYKADLAGKANSDDLTAIGNRVAYAESRITADAIVSTVRASENYQSDLAAKASQTTVEQLATSISAKVDSDGVISAINLLKGKAQIIADCIQIGEFTYGDAGGVQKAFYCGGKIGSSSTSTGFSASNSDWAFWAGSGAFRVAQNGTLIASNATIKGTLSSGNWTFNESGAQYTNGANWLKMYFEGSMARFYANGYAVTYGSDASNEVTIEGNDIILNPRHMSAQSIRIGYGESSKETTLNDVSIFNTGSTAQKNGSSWQFDTHGNIGTAVHPWNWTYTEHIQYETKNIWSSRKVKQDIVYLSDVSRIVDSLKPAKFAYKFRPDRTRYGLIYEDVLPVLPEICFEPEDKEHGVPSLNYDDLLPIALMEIKNLRARVRALELASAEME